jgi:coenzyme F420-0:L-glutamate ligase/coenzyme F420-1:gamma-L-glutamate ligase
MAYPELRVIGLTGIPEIKAGDDLAGLILQAATAQGTPLQDGDVLVVTQKAVSKAEGQVVDLGQVEPSSFARTLAAQWGKDPRHIEVVLRESRRVVKMDRGVLITETRHGLVCANAGVDMSNVPGEGCVTLLPLDPDASAQRIREEVRQQAGKSVAVLISDTFSRTWRMGTTNIAIGSAGINPLRDDRGQRDPHGYLLQASVAAVADELAGAAELVAEKTRGVPVVIVRGLRYQTSPDSSQALIREPSEDLFR